MTVQPFNGPTDQSTLRARTTKTGRLDAPGRSPAGLSRNGEEHE